MPGYYHQLALRNLAVLGIGAVLMALIITSNNQFARADCVQDLDWPEKPCLDTPPYPESYLKAIWEEYYELKGSEWMEMKKVEMDKAIENGTLKEWAEHQSEPNNFANFNVYYYYFLNGQAPDINEYSSNIRWDTSLPMLDETDTPIVFELVVVIGTVLGGAAAGIFYCLRRSNRFAAGKNEK